MLLSSSEVGLSTEEQTDGVILTPVWTEGEILLVSSLLPPVTEDRQVELLEL